MVSPTAPVSPLFSHSLVVFPMAQEVNILDCHSFIHFSTFYTLWVCNLDNKLLLFFHVFLFVEHPYLVFHSIVITQKREKIDFIQVTKGSFCLYPALFSVLPVWLFLVDYNFFDFLLSSTKCSDYLPHITAIHKPRQLWSISELLVTHLYQINGFITGYKKVDALAPWPLGDFKCWF